MCQKKLGICDCFLWVSFVGDVLKLDQNYLETVIPAEGKQMLILNGIYRGRKAILKSIDIDRYAVNLRIEDGPDKGKTVSVPYEDASKISAWKMPADNLQILENLRGSFEILFRLDLPVVFLREASTLRACLDATESSGFQFLWSGSSTVSVW